jgi:acyl-CoA synthetase (AMP-forming)/AMP-acid ligase II
VFLHDLVASSARAYPTRTALECGDQTFTFGELHQRIEVSAAFIASRTEVEDRVALIGDNDPTWVECYYSVPRARRTLVTLNHRLLPDELARLVAHSGTSMVIGPSGQLDRLRGSAELPPGVDLVDLGTYDNSLAQLRRDGIPTLATPTDPKVPTWLIYTSGTTGAPKGAVLTHRSLLAAVAATAHGRPVASDETYLFPFPLCHVAGYNVLRHHAVGRPVVLLARFDPAAFVDAVDRHRVTSASVAATMLSALLDHLGEVGSAEQLRTLRVIAYGAAPMPIALLERARSMLDVGFVQGYGMTELSGNAVFLDAEFHRRGLAGDRHLLGAAGRPAPGVAVRVVDDQMSDIPHGQPGEIVIQAEQVMSGYWNDVEGTREAFSAGWFRTGDIGRWGDLDVLYVVDRKKDVIVSGGENIATGEVEDALDSLPGVRAAAVIGVPDPHWGQNVCAVIVRADGAPINGEQVIAGLRSRLAGYKIPRHIVFVDQLPVNASGKVRKQELRDWLGDRPELLGHRDGQPGGVPATPAADAPGTTHSLPS